MNNLRKKIREILKEMHATESLKGFSDFKDEFKWYQQNGGIGSQIPEDELEKRFEDAKITTVSSDELDKYSNSYTSLIKGNEEERFEKFKELYLKEDRGSYTRANTEEEKVKYLKGVIEAVRNNSVEPSLVIDIEGIGRLIIGGRTRAAAAKVIDKKDFKIKVVSIYADEIDYSKAKSTFDSIVAK